MKQIVTNRFLFDLKNLFLFDLIDLTSRLDIVIYSNFLYLTFIIFLLFHQWVNVFTQIYLSNMFVILSFFFRERRFDDSSLFRNLKTLLRILLINSYNCKIQKFYDHHFSFFNVLLSFQRSIKFDDNFWKCFWHDSIFYAI